MLIEIALSVAGVSTAVLGALADRWALRRTEEPLKARSAVVEAILHSAKVFPEAWVEVQRLDDKANRHRFWYLNEQLDMAVCETGWVRGTRVWLEPEDLTHLYNAVQGNLAHKLYDRMGER